MPESICVIGCSGYVGTHVAAELLSQGYNVHGTLRDSETNAAWIHAALDGFASVQNSLSLFAADFADRDSLEHAMQGCTGVIMCAGTTAPELATVDTMINGATNTVDAAQNCDINRIVFTSSTGSTNPAEGEPEIKNELDHWSDPDFQLAANKFGPASKTRMDQTALHMMEQSNDTLRLSIINPSLITGPAFQHDPVGSLNMFLNIIEGRRFADSAPNGSMSMIDVRDLAKLHVAALQNQNASGRYFGVKESYHWVDILDAIHRAYPAYTPPPFPQDEQKITPTRFDLSRQQSLGVNVRGLDEMVIAAIGELKRRDLLS